MRWDGLTALDRWVDGGAEPVNQIATDSAQATAGRTRPLCEYPTWPRYLGKGDANTAASFLCNGCLVDSELLELALAFEALSAIHVTAPLVAGDLRIGT